MREILFRGKLKYKTLTGKHAGDWVEGGFMLEAAGDPCITETYGDVMLFHHVIPETAGEFTGIRDCMGIPIFDGDVVRRGKRILSDDPDHYEYEKCIVIFRRASFMAELESGEFTHLFLISEDELSVIGNIHDNPELLLGRGR
jgi:uncharacterized phage protein (TIGR01671 family)